MRTTDQIIKDALKAEIVVILSSFNEKQVGLFYRAFGEIDHLSIDELRSGLALCQRSVRAREAKAST